MATYRILDPANFIMPGRIWGLNNSTQGPQWSIARSIARANKISRWKIRHTDEKGVYCVELMRSTQGSFGQDMKKVGEVIFEVTL
jgi:hypothetical protein